jgi:predicted transcriptional regulator
MSTLTDKQELIDWIRELDDPAMLENLKAFKANIDGNAVAWDELTETEREGIKRGLEDVKAGRVHPHEEVRKSYKKWL